MNSSPHTRSTPDLSTPTTSIFEATGTPTAAAADEDGEDEWVTDDGSDDEGEVPTCLAAQDLLLQGCWEVESTLPRGRGAFDQAGTARVLRAPGSECAADGTMRAVVVGERCSLNVLHSGMLQGQEHEQEQERAGGQRFPLITAELPTWLALAPHAHMLNVLALEVDYERGLLLLLEREGCSLREVLDGVQGSSNSGSNSSSGSNNSNSSNSSSSSSRSRSGGSGSGGQQMEGGGGAAAAAEPGLGAEEEAAAAACRAALATAAGVVTAAAQIVAALQHLHGSSEEEEEEGAAAKAPRPPAVYGALAAGLESVRLWVPQIDERVLAAAPFHLKLASATLSVPRAAAPEETSSLSARMEAVALEEAAGASAAQKASESSSETSSAAADVKDFGRIVLELERRRLGGGGSGIGIGCEGGSLSAEQLREAATTADGKEGGALLALALQCCGELGEGGREGAPEAEAPPPPALAEVRARVAALCVATVGAGGAAARGPSLPPASPSRSLPAASLAFRRGLWCHGLSDAEGAAALYRAAVDADAAHTPALMAHASILDEVLDDVDGAEAVWKRVLALQSSHGSALTKMADLFDQVYGAADQAEVLYRRAVAAEPCNTDALLGLGSLLFEKAGGDEGGESSEAEAAACVAEAEQLWRRAVELDPRDSKSLCNLGSLLASSGKADAEAEAFFRQALTAAPGGYDEEALANLAMLLEQKPGREKEVAQLRALAEQPVV